MQLLRRGHQFEYRDGEGVDHLGVVDVWASAGGDEAVLVLRDVAHPDAASHARRALNTLNHTYLPYLLRPGVRLAVLVLRPRGEEDTKARGFVLPLSA